MSACILDVDVGSGHLTTRSVEVATVDRVATRSFLDVEIAAGPVQTIAVTCDDNLQDNIDVFVDGGTLVFDTFASVNIHASAGCRAQVTLPALSAAQTRGSGDLRIAGLPCSDMRLETYGSGHIGYAGHCARMWVKTTGSGGVHLEGQSQGLSLESRGSGDIDASGWSAQDVSALTKGSGDLRFTAHQSVVATSRGSGDIQIFGPALQRTVKSTGSGDISFH